MTSKIIVVGEVNGQLGAMCAKLSTLHAKNNFNLGIVTGNLFGNDDAEIEELLDGKIHIPLPLYFTVGNQPLPASVMEKLSCDEEICHNLHYLGKRTTVTTSEGIRIVALGGILDDTIIAGTSKEQFLPFHTVDDAKALKGAKTADILLTCAWPQNIQVGSKVPVPQDAVAPVSYGHISELCSTLEPRYFFSSSTFFFEREPFFHPPTSDAPERKVVTRFLSIAPYGNPAKQKSFFAFNLQPSVDPLAALPIGTTASPFREFAPKRKAFESEGQTRFSDSHYSNHHRNKRGRRNPPPGPDTCFFCLSNPNIGTHLVTSIGEDAYVTTAKGPLTTSTTYKSSNINFPAHALIIPLEHSPIIALIPEEEARQKTYSEMARFKSGIQSMIAKQSSNKLGAVTFEISRGEGVHTHWQILPMAVDLIRRGLVEAAFKVEAENMSYPLFQVRDPGIGLNDGDFFRFWVWAPPLTNTDDDEEEEESENAPTKTAVIKCLTMPLDSNLRFDLQFARRVLAKLLGLEKRVQWRECEQAIEEEKADVDAFKAAFKEFDFTLE